MSDPLKTTDLSDFMTWRSQLLTHPDSKHMNSQVTGLLRIDSSGTFDSSLLEKQVLSLRVQRVPHLLLLESESIQITHRSEDVVAIKARLRAFKSLASSIVVTLGLHFAGPENIPTYLRIYSPQENDDWVVWVANRNQPVERDSVVLLLDHSVPAPGPLKLEREPIRKKLIIKNREKVYWKSGELMKNNRFEYISGETFQYKVVSNKDEDYFTYTTPDEDLTIWTLLENGQLINRKGSDIAKADLCNGYNANDGCQKEGKAEILPICRDPGDVFDSKSGYPDYKLLHNLTNASYSLSDCQANCWSNCSYFGFKNLYDNGIGGVFLVSTKGLNIASSGDYLFYILVKNTTDHKGDRRWPQVKCLRRYSGGDDLEGDLSDGDDLKVFSHSSIIVATNIFSSDNKLGQGGFGPVFKGILPSGKEVAVKKLSKTSGQGMTDGYMSPDYAMEGVFSTKSDVYSFGVMLLEIISGEKNNSFYSEDRPLNLVGHAWELWKEGVVLQLVDPLLNESFSEDEVLRCVNDGLLCVEENADDRPTMSNVISMLTNKIKVDVLPKKPAYYVRTRVFEEETYCEEVGIDSTTEGTLESERQRVEGEGCNLRSVGGFLHLRSVVPWIVRCSTPSRVVIIPTEVIKSITQERD
nr:nodulation protein [Melilotus officinalis]